jgi:p-aminobenzoyl-glutamate transporter AbgT
LSEITSPGLLQRLDHFLAEWLIENVELVGQVFWMCVFLYFFWLLANAPVTTLLVEYLCDKYLGPRVEYLEQQ